MDIGIINNSEPWTGVGRYAHTLFHHLLNQPFLDVHHIYLDWESRIIDVVNQEVEETKKGRSKSIPMVKYLWYAAIQHKIPGYSINHITNQNISFLNVKNKIVTVHDIFHVTHPSTPLHKVFGIVAYSGIEDAVHIIANSNYTKNQIVSYYNINPDKITVIYLGVEDYFFQNKNDAEYLLKKYRLPKDGKFLIHLSNEQPHKNFDKILLAFKAFLENTRSSDYYLLKVGKALYKEDRVRHMKMIKEMGILDRVIFLESVPDEDLPGLYRMSVCLLFPSSREGFGFPPLESMAAGTPVITSGEASLAEIVGDSGIIINPNDATNFSNAIARICEDKELRDILRERGMKRASEFSWKRTIEQTIEVYRRVL